MTKVYKNGHVIIIIIIIIIIILVVVVVVVPIVSLSFLNDLIIRVNESRRQVVRACSTYEGEEVDTGVWLGNLREGSHLEDPDVDERIILTWNF
jgi:flagellar basal body-associated protein FliL